jgi:hypothetical protein
MRSRSSGPSRSRRASTGHGREARELVRPLGAHDRLAAARPSSCPKTQGVVSAIQQTKFALSLAKRGKVPPPFPPHVAANVHEARALFDVVRSSGRRGAAGIVQGERALSRIEHTDHGGGASRRSRDHAR